MAVVALVVSGSPVAARAQTGTPSPLPVPTPAPSPTVDDAALARQFSPHLYFDSRERWRPIDVDAFLKEAGIRACQRTRNKPRCVPFLGPQQLTPEFSYLDLAGIDPAGEDARAPDIRACGRSHVDLYDCDLDARSVIYAHVTHEPSEIAIDYWWYFRFNALVSRHVLHAWPPDNHEGDWEGVTVVTDSGGRDVREVHYAAHSKVWRYNAVRPRFEQTHPVVYVAKGTHASYPRRCASMCHQTGRPLPERSYDGARAWTGNLDTTSACCVRLFPAGPSAVPSWNTWNGRWGRSDFGDPTKRGPLTPSAQSRYLDPLGAESTDRRPARKFS